MVYIRARLGAQQYVTGVPRPTSNLLNFRGSLGREGAQAMQVHAKRLPSSSAGLRNMSAKGEKSREELYLKPFLTTPSLFVLNDGQRDDTCSRSH